MMKKNKILLVLGCLSLGVGSFGIAQVVSAPTKKANATDGVVTTFDFTAATYAGSNAESLHNKSLTIDNIKMSTTSASAVGAYSNPARFYSGYAITMEGITTVAGTTSTSVSTISSIVFTCSSAAYATALSGATWTGGTAAANNTVVTVTPTATTVTFNLAAQSRISSIVFTYNTTVTTVSPVESVSLSKTSGTYNVTGGETITASVLPSGATQGVTWSTSDEFVATVSGGTIYAVGAGTATITATSIGTASDGSAKSASFTVTVNSFGISGLRDSAGAILNSGKIVAVTGTVTKVVVGDGVYIQAGTTFAGAKAVYGFSYSTTASSATVGNLCTIKGTISSYNGLLELTGASFKTSATVGETITPIAISSGFTSTNLVGHDSVMISLPSLRLTTAATITSGTASTISCTLGGSEAVSLRADKAVSSADATTINTMFGKIGTGGAFSYAGVLGWYNGPQASLTEASQLSLPSATSTEITNVETFVSTYLNITAGTCSERWSAAKTAYLALAAEEQAIFKTGSAYADMLKRYNAWAAANGDTALSSPEVSVNGDSTNIALYALGGIAILAAGAFFVFRKKKQA